MATNGVNGTHANGESKSINDIVIVSEQSREELQTPKKSHYLPRVYRSGAP